MAAEGGDAERTPGPAAVEGGSRPAGRRQAGRSRRAQFFALVAAIACAFAVHAVAMAILTERKLALQQHGAALSDLMDSWHRLLQVTNQLPYREVRPRQALDEGRELLAAFQAKLDVFDRQRAQERLLDEALRGDVASLAQALRFGNPLIEETYAELATFIERNEAAGRAAMLGSTLYQLLRNVGGHAPSDLLSYHRTFQDVRGLSTSFTSQLEVKQERIQRAIQAEIARLTRIYNAVQVVLVAFVATAVALLLWRLVRLFREMEASEREVLRLNTTLELRVAERTAQLEEANKELEAFSYSVSHDLRAPLRHVDGYVQMLEQRVGASADQATRHYMVRVHQAARRMGNLIDDLLSLSRLGRRELARERVELDALVREVVVECVEGSEGREVDWRVGPLPAVLGDRSLLRLALVNLVFNAFKFTRTRPRAVIEIGAEAAAASEVLIFVRDNGVGFDPAYGHKLFGVFQRLHGAEEFEGTGIGLATVRRAVTRMGGRAWAEGELGVGATFRLALPAAGPWPAAPAGASPSPPAAAGGWLSRDRTGSAG